MQSLALVVHVLLAIGVIGLVLMQHGKGADAGAAFGSGASATVFGARGSASFLTRMTTALAALFFLTSLTLFYLAANRDRESRSVTDSVTDSVIEEAPAEPTTGDTDLPQPAEGGSESNVTEPTDDALPAPADEGSSNADSVGDDPGNSATSEEAAGGTESGDEGGAPDASEGDDSGSESGAADTDTESGSEAELPAPAE